MSIYKRKPDIIIKSGTIVDGTGAPAYFADIAIIGDKIDFIGDLKGVDAPLIIDAHHKYVTPGFIDIHSHSDSVPFFNSLPQGKIMQGVTLEISENCGSGIVPIDGDHREEAEAYSKTKTGPPL